MADLTVIYRKTPAGNQELKAKALGLSREQRNLLIVTDGRLPLSTYAKAVGCEIAALGEIADGLLQHGLVAAASAAKPAVAAPAAEVAASSAPSLGDLHARIVELGRAVFGPQAAGVMHKLEVEPASVAELNAVVDAATKLAKLTIDLQKAQAFASEARKILGT
jgi:hypothetical protein